MAQAKTLLMFTDSYGRRAEQAERVDGQWFQRWQDQGQFGAQFTKWQACEAPKKTAVTHAHTGEVIGEDYHWGFNRVETILTNEAEKIAVRLPN